jgi:aerobic carbon-monoxide dehydrogenase medium subunit
VKPPPFEYSRPSSLDEALALLDSLGPDGKVLAGGQSLVPLLSMRLAAPRHIVDINRLDELAYVRVDGSGVRVGALARHADVEHDAPAASAQPLLRRALQLVAHPTIRNRGTVVGSLAHADPAAELPAVLAVLGGSVRLASVRGIREVAAEDFFLGPLESALRPGELAVEAFFPRLPEGTGASIVEVARRHGDYAVCGVCAVRSGHSARVAFLSVAPTPVVLDVPDVALAQELAQSSLNPEPDIHASADYRRHLAGVLTMRALREAA